MLELNCKDPGMFTSHCTEVLDAICRKVHNNTRCEDVWHNLVKDEEFPFNDEGRQISARIVERLRIQGKDVTASRIEFFFVTLTPTHLDVDEAATEALIDNILAGDPCFDLIN